MFLTIFTISKVKEQPPFCCKIKQETFKLNNGAIAGSNETFSTDNEFSTNDYLGIHF